MELRRSISQCISQAILAVPGDTSWCDDENILDLIRGLRARSLDDVVTAAVRQCAPNDATEEETSAVLKSTLEKLRKSRAKFSARTRAKKYRATVAIESASPALASATNACGTALSSACPGVDIATVSDEAEEGIGQLPPAQSPPAQTPPAQTPPAQTPSAGPHHRRAGCLR